MTAIQDARILIMATDGFEQSELLVPRDKLREAGATVEVATPDGQEIKGWDETDWGDKVSADLPIEQVSVDRYDAIVLPGGQINPDKLRTDENAVKVVKQFLSSGKIVAAICHGPWMLVEADGLRGRTVTSFKSIKTDVSNAGATWVDKEVVTDQGIITSRAPKDLPAFVAKIIEEIGEGRHQRAA